MWIKLTKSDDTQEYLNINRSIRMHTTLVNGQIITRIYNDTGSVAYKETPEQIIDLMRQEYERQRSS